METTNALVAAALAGVFAAGSTVSQASLLPAGQVPAEREKYECLSKDNNLHQCKGTIEATVMNGKHMHVQLPNDKGMGKGKKKDKDEEDEGGLIP
jgi:hypothetical protein